MMVKKELSENEFVSQSFLVQKTFMAREKFFFYFSPDPDAIGVSIALALHLRKLGKESIIYFPTGYDFNLNFLIQIAEFNDIVILNSYDQLQALISKEEYVFVTCDTPTNKLLPDFEKIINIFNSYETQVSIEIDHHFGGDSELIYSNSFCLFAINNSCCEIVADFLQIISGGPFGSPEFDKFFPRNIVLSLLVGMCYDTQLGQFLINRASYESWFTYLSSRLISLTWTGSSYLKTAEEVFFTINKMSQIKKDTIANLVASATYQNGVGLLILPQVGKYESLAENNAPSCMLSKISSDIANELPEKAGKVGILCYYDETKEQFLLKIRRSTTFKTYDLRDLEIQIRNVYKNDYIGGGGHPGATSFRIQTMERERFINLMTQTFQEIVMVIDKARVRIQ